MQIQSLNRTGILANSQDGLFELLCFSEKYAFMKYDLTMHHCAYKLDGYGSMTTDYFAANWSTSYTKALKVAVLFP